MPSTITPGNALPAFDSRQLRDVLGQFVTGVTIITTVDALGRPHGLTANSFSSVSLDPPLVLWSQSRTAPSHSAFTTCGHFAVHILASSQVELSDRFARSGDKFADLAVGTGLGGVPLLEGCTARLECRRIASHPGGDHLVFIGQVERLEHHARPPLAFGGGRYLAVRPHDTHEAVASG